MPDSTGKGRRPEFTRCAAVVAVLTSCAGLWAQSATEPTLDVVLRRMGAFIAGYGEQASLIVAVERYTQRVTGRRPRALVAEFAVVKAPADEGWTGYRDVIEVNGRRIPDRADRLRKLFTDPSPPAGLLREIDTESARFNVGPITRNINLPTTALYFLHPVRQHRFAFKRTGGHSLDGIGTWEISFTETATPTIIKTRAGRNVPIDGTVWVVPEDGTVAKTRFRLRGFADTGGMRESQVAQVEPVPPPPPPPPSSGGGATSAPRTPPPPPPTQLREVVKTVRELVRIESLVDIEVTYRRHDDLGLWLPSKMTELYEGAIWGSGSTELGRAETVATYSDFKRFTTDVRLRDPK